MFVLNANVGRLFKSPPHNPPRSPFSSKGDEKFYLKIHKNFSVDKLQRVHSFVLASGEIRSMKRFPLQGQSSWTAICVLLKPRVAPCFTGFTRGY